MKKILYKIIMTILMTTLLISCGQSKAESKTEVNENSEIKFKNTSIDPIITDTIVVDANYILQGANYSVSRLNLPYLDIQSEDANIINTQIYSLFKEYSRTNPNPTADNPFYTNINYNYVRLANMLAILIVINQGGTAEDIYLPLSYNIDIDTGKRIYFSEFVEGGDTTAEHVASMIEEIATKNIKEIYKDSDRDDLMQQDIEKTMQWVNEKIEYDELEFYMNDNYELCFLVKEYQSILQSGEEERIYIYPSEDVSPSEYVDFSDTFQTLYVNSDRGNSYAPSVGYGNNEVGTVISEFQGGKDFSEGYTFVEAKYGDGYKYACIDKNGVIQFVIEGKDRPYTDFSGGTALISFIEDNKDKKRLVNTKGEVITTPSLAGYDEIVIPPMAYNGQSVNVEYVGINGYYIAKRSIDTFEKTGTELGILAPDGSWAIDPTDEISIIDYAGDGVYVIFYKDDNMSDKIFDTKTGELLDAVNANILIQKNILLTNGYLVVRDNKNKDFEYGCINVFNRLGEVVLRIPRTFNYDIQEDGDKARFSRDSSNDRISQYSDGVFYYDKNFYNIDGTVALSIVDKRVFYKNYLGSVIPEFYDGYCLIGLTNDQGSKFFTSINKAGEIVMEPFKTQEISSQKEGIFKYFEGNGKLVYRNVNGQVCHEYQRANNLEISRINDFSDGVCYIAVGNGEFYYIDKAGNRLFQGQNYEYNDSYSENIYEYNEENNNEYSIDNIPEDNIGNDTEENTENVTEGYVDNIDDNNVNSSVVSEVDNSHKPNITEGEYIKAVNNNFYYLLENSKMTADDIENEVKRIREIWVRGRESQANGAFEEVQLREGIIAYKDYNTPSNVHLIEIQRDKDKGDFDYAKTFLYEDGKLIFAYYEGKDSHRMYFRNNDMFRWRYCPDATNSSDYLNYDQYYEDYQFQYWSTEVFIESLTWYTKA